MVVEGIVLVIFVAILIGLQRMLKRKLEYRYKFKAAIEETGLPIIRLKINEKEYYFLVDSGSDVNIIDVTCPESFMIVGEQVFTDASNVVHKGTIVKVHAEWDTIHVFNFEAILSDITEALGKINYAGHPITGILGTAFLRKYKYIIDFEKQEVRI